MVPLPPVDLPPPPPPPPPRVAVYDPFEIATSASGELDKYEHVNNCAVENKTYTREWKNP
jgi:hypothetical protein